MNKYILYTLLALAVNSGHFRVNVITPVDNRITKNIDIYEIIVPSGLSCINFKYGSLVSRGESAAKSNSPIEFSMPTDQLARAVACHSPLFRGLEPRLSHTLKTLYL